MTRPSRRWLRAFGRHEWSANERSYASLLDALTRDRVETEALGREMSAPAVQETTDVSQLQREELEEARRELDEFRAALDDIHSRAAGSERTEVPYDSANPAQDAAADVLIQYLVRPGYAEVRTEEPQSGQYIYNIRVDWPRLRAVAEAAGHPLERSK
jgi:hypothetical protein